MKTGVKPLVNELTISLPVSSLNNPSSLSGGVLVALLGYSIVHV